jgi:hypothetical protein
VIPGINFISQKGALEAPFLMAGSGGSAMHPMAAIHPGNDLELRENSEKKKPDHCIEVNTISQLIDYKQSFCQASYNVEILRSSKNGRQS